MGSLARPLSAPALLAAALALVAPGSSCHCDAPHLACTSPLDCPAGDSCDDGLCTHAALTDAGTRRDAGTPLDAGAPLDGGTPLDAGAPLDAGTVDDAGTPFDAGTLDDAGTPLDAGTVDDAGAPLDAGTADPCPAVSGAGVTAFFDGHCYAAFPDNESWEAAAFRCDVLHGIPAVPSTDAELGFLAGSMVLPGLDPFVGVTDIGAEGSFATITGETFVGGFNEGEPNNSGGIEDCLQYALRAGVTDGYNDEICNAPFNNGDIVSSTLCEYPAAGATSFCGDGVLQPGLGEACDDGNNVDGDACPADCSGPPVATPVVYAVTGGRLLLGFNQVPVAYDVGRQRCLDIGGDLAIPTNQQENDDVTTVADRLGAGSVWIGYVDGRGGVEAFADATLFRRVDDDVPIGGGFQHFGLGEPSNGNGGLEDCVELRAGSGDWNDTLCDTTRLRAFVCEVFPP